MFRACCGPLISFLADSVYRASVVLKRPIEFLAIIKLILKKALVLIYCISSGYSHDRETNAAR